VAYELPVVRARIGLIIPSSNRLAEPQLRKYAPEGVIPHFTRLRMTGPHHVPLEALLPRVAEAAQTLGDAKCDVIVFHCTAGSMENGLEGERRVIDTIQQATGRRAITTATGVMAAFNTLGSRRLALITPYDAETNAHEIAFLAQAGLEVARNRPMDLGGSDGYISAPPSLWLRVAQEEADPRADTCFLSCTNIHSPDVIEPIEAALGRPVVASNQATLWYCLRLLGLPDVVPGLGRLMRLRIPVGAGA
jgi:maleate cis-trans isomerase